MGINLDVNHMYETRLLTMFIMVDFDGTNSFFQETNENFDDNKLSTIEMCLCVNI